MNKEFTHVNNQAIIKDETGNTKIIPYYDNLEQVLIQENVIELIEEEMKKVIENYEYFKDKEFNYIPFATLSLSFLGYFAMPELFKAIGAPEEWLNQMGRIWTNYETIKYMGLFMGIPSGLLMDYSNFNSCNENRKRKNAVTSKKELLEKQIEFEKELLEDLQNDKTNSRIQTENDYEIININNDLVRKNVQNLINFFYNLGYNEKKLYRSFIKDKLDKYYSGNLLRIANEYFEEKGPILARKYNKIKNDSAIQ